MWEAGRRRLLGPSQPLGSSLRPSSPQVQAFPTASTQAPGPVQCWPVCRGQVPRAQGSVPEAAWPHAFSRPVAGPGRFCLCS